MGRGLNILDGEWKRESAAVLLLAFPFRDTYLKFYASEIYRTSVPGYYRGLYGEEMSYTFSEWKNAKAPFESTVPLSPCIFVYYSNVMEFSDAGWQVLVSLD